MKPADGPLEHTKEHAVGEKDPMIIEIRITFEIAGGWFSKARIEEQKFDVDIENSRLHSVHHEMRGGEFVVTIKSTSAVATQRANSTPPSHREQQSSILMKGKVVKFSAEPKKLK